ncbi:MAG: hypothetical protein J6U18_04890 [Acetobacter sp.]|nr:hypothetical protein [Acetobacter sp.]
MNNTSPLLSHTKETCSLKKRNFFRTACVFFFTFISLSLLIVLLFFIDISFRPLSIKPVLRYFLPLTIIPAQSGHPPVQLDFRNISLYWNIFHKGLNAPITLSATDITLQVPQHHGSTHKISTNSTVQKLPPPTIGSVYDSIQHLTLVLDPRALFHGIFAPKSLVIHQAQFSLIRNHNNTIGLDFGQTSDVSSHNNIPITLNNIEHITLDNVTITLRDSLVHTCWRISPLNAHLNLHTINQQKGLIGTLSATLANRDIPTNTIHFTARGTLTNTPINTIRKQSQNDSRETLPLPILTTLKNTNIQNISLLPTQKMTFRSQKVDKGILWHMEIATPHLGVFDHTIPAFSLFDVPLTISVDTWFSPTFSRYQKLPKQQLAEKKTSWLLPQKITLHTVLGAGHMSIAGSTYEADHGQLNLTLQQNMSDINQSPLTQLKLSNTEIVLRHPQYPLNNQHQLTLHLNGQLTVSNFLTPSTINGTLTADIPHVAFQDLNYYWPNKAAKGGKQWVTRNITSGMASHLYTQIRFKSSQGWKHLKITGLDGNVDARGLTIHWLRPITPIKNMHARLEIHNLHVLTIDFNGGYQPIGRYSRIKTGPGRMTISHLERKIPTGTIVSDLEGKLDSVLKLLKEPRLHLFVHRKLNLSNPRGNTKIAFKISLPLAKHIKNSDILINVHANITHAALDNVVAGRGITNGHFILDADTSKLSLSGQGMIGNIPSRIFYSANLHHAGPQEILEQAHVTSCLTPALLAAAGYHTDNYFYGSTNLTVQYRQMGNHTSTIQVGLDLTPALIKTPLWRKKIGQPAEASASIELTHGHIATIQHITALGQGISLLGNATIYPDKSFELFLSSFQIANSVGQAQFVFPTFASDKAKFLQKQKRIVYANIQASRLDLSSLISHRLSDQKIKKELQHTSDLHKTQTMKSLTWIVNVAAQNLWYSKNKPPISGVTASFEESKNHLEKLNFSMRDPTPVQISLTPVKQQRVVTARIKDVGHLLAAFNILPDVQGGNAILKGSFNDTEPSDPFSGKITVSPFVLNKAPTTLRIMRDVSLPSWITAQNSSNLKITHLTIPLTFENGTIKINNARTGNMALGATIKGIINITQNNIHLRGTVAPLFAINRLPGKIPGLGWIFSPERGSGILAFTFDVTGKLKKPTLHINPFSILLPGALRHIL